MPYRITPHCFLLFFFLSFLVKDASGQKGSQDIYKDIEKLGVLANVLYVAAHPDDENTRLISYLSNHLHARTTYLSMTRGDGGQNLIGPEIREMLGIIRSNELLQARRIDGGNQLFTRANDFGYSKSPSETFTIWNRNDVLSDVVWAIRKMRPDVIINRFSTDTSRPNHGHHTASAMLSAEAFDLAGSPGAFPEQLEFVNTWQPHRQYYNTSWWFYGSREAFDKADKSKMTVIDIGAFDPMTGESNSEIAARSRSMHKSQGFGAAETRGENLDYLELLKDEKGAIPSSLFDGINITWSRVAGGEAIGKKVDQLKREFDFHDPSKSLPLLFQIHAAILNLADPYWREIKLAECEEIIRSCMGLYLELSTDKFRLAPGSTVPVTLEAINRSNVPAKVLAIAPVNADTVFHVDQSLAYNQDVEAEFTFSAPEILSIPYWLRDTPAEGMYVVASQQQRGLPANPPSMSAEVTVEVSGQPLHFNLPVVYKAVDPAIGEITRPLYITPPVAAEITGDALVFNQGETRKIGINLKAIQDNAKGTLKLFIDQPGWRAVPETIDFSFQKSGESKTVYCDVTPPNAQSRAHIRPEIWIDGKVYHHKISTIEYSHLPYMDIVRDASTPVQSLDIKIVRRPIGYIRGAGDEVPACLRQLGYRIDELDPDNITPESLQGYQVILLGVRVYNTVDAMAYKNNVLFDWVKNGGTLITQYNVSNNLVTTDVAPFALKISRDRVTEENAPVTILAPNHPAFTFPNHITAADFDGWVQERGLYFPDTWDAQCVPLLEMNDTGESPKQGSLLVAEYGKGYFVYSGLSWFRHLPAGVPGAYRLLSNLIALGYKTDKP